MNIPRVPKLALEDSFAPSSAPSRLMSSPTNVPPHSLPASPLLMTGAQRGLKTRRKLALFLDIDHTILHAIATKHIPYNLLSIMDDMFFFKLSTDPVDGSTVFCLVKCRPGLYQFLQTVSKNYDIYLCTFGTYIYAKEILERLVQRLGVSVIQPQLITREYIMSHEDAYTPRTKTVKKNLTAIIDLIKGDFDPSMAVLIDDRNDVWYDNDVAQNLLKIHPYSFFSGMSSPPQQPGTIGPLGPSHHLRMAEMPQINLASHGISDNCMNQMMKLLTFIHRKFYEEADGKITGARPASPAFDSSPAASPTTGMIARPPHVRKFVMGTRRTVLHGTKLFLHGLAKDLRIMAEMFGAQIAQDLSEGGITHLVSSKQEQDQLLKMLPQELAQRIYPESSSPSDSDSSDDEAKAPPGGGSLVNSGALTASGEMPASDRLRANGSKVFLVAYNWIRESAKDWKRASEYNHLLPFSPADFASNGDADVAELL